MNDGRIKTTVAGNAELEKSWGQIVSQTRVKEINTVLVMYVLTQATLISHKISPSVVFLPNSRQVW